RGGGRGGGLCRPAATIRANASTGWEILQALRRTAWFRGGYVPLVTGCISSPMFVGLPAAAAPFGWRARLSLSRVSAVHLAKASSLDRAISWIASRAARS